MCESLSMNYFSNVFRPIVFFMQSTSISFIEGRATKMQIKQRTEVGHLISFRLEPSNKKAVNTKLDIRNNQTEQ